MKYESPAAGGGIQAFLNAFEPNAPVISIPAAPELYTV
jgi:hypothetical protein